MRPHGHATAVAKVTILVMLSVAGATAKSCQQYQQATLSVLSKVIWPTSRNIAASQVPPPEFATNVNGRVVPVGVFSTSLGALEYFYRLSGPLDPRDTISTRVSEANVRWMVCDNQKRQVAFECLFRFISPANPAADFNISAMGVFSFNKDGKICAYDWDLRRLGFVIDSYERNVINANFGGNPAVYQEQVRLGICSTAMTLCNGTNAQYASIDACFTFLKSKPIGPDGGGKCVEHPVNSLFTDDVAACAAQ